MHIKIVPTIASIDLSKDFDQGVAMLSTQVFSKIAICGVFVALAFGADSLQSHSSGTSLKGAGCELSLNEMEKLYRVGSIVKDSGNCVVSIN